MGKEIRQLKFVVALRTFWDRQAGQDMIEYALVAGFFAVLAAASIPGAVLAVSHAFARIVSDLNALAASVTVS
jgi:Flp pilus assembly pilin Flp